MLKRRRRRLQADQVDECLKVHAMRAHVDAWEVRNRCLEVLDLEGDRGSEVGEEAEDNAQAGDEVDAEVWANKGIEDGVGGREPLADGLLGGGGLQFLEGECPATLE